MSLFNNRRDAKHQNKTTMHDYPNYLPHKDEPVDFYRKYGNDGFTPIKGHRNPRNLFDDSDIKDNYWFNIAKKYLKNAKF